MKFNIGSKGTLLSQPRQQGIALLVFFIVIFLAGAGAIITVLDNNIPRLRRSTDTMIALREAKEAL